MMQEFKHTATIENADGCNYRITFKDGTVKLIGDGSDLYWKLADLLDTLHETSE
ncbi:hypothetical protein PBI_PEREGRIN_274 [Rhodococcus phage Peregrin]|nr:hypothetical protein PBI_PEREGRIN_274 [Rhodococcus phage Peregrin]